MKRFLLATLAVMLIVPSAFAVPALQSLAGRGYTPLLVVTPPPRRAGRGRRLQQVPLAQMAEDLQIPLHRTNDVNGRTSRGEIEAVTDGRTWRIEEGTIYALDRHDEHYLRADPGSDLRLVCVFNPPLTGRDKPG